MFLLFLKALVSIGFHWFDNVGDSFTVYRLIMSSITAPQRLREREREKKMMMLRTFLRNSLPKNHLRASEGQNRSNLNISMQFLGIVYEYCNIFIFNP